ncbi:hypothetical protein JB92DRAFT_2893102 [Gautieria morchelliformis]|nr:hypothetical protein JB92DRAFT_2893102 [Gautieria morchelliformis]
MVFWLLVFNSLSIWLLCLDNRTFRVISISSCLPVPCTGRTAHISSTAPPSFPVYGSFCSEFNESLVNESDALNSFTMSK